MGVLTISTRGSFTNHVLEDFSAMHGGHAMAVAEAIEYLSSVLMPKAIEQDHNLHTDGHEPDIGFGKKGEKL